jgi:catechol 2,3-dioxygenase-like lactoylglutathione lyase family enzyme
VPGDRSSWGTAAPARERRPFATDPYAIISVMERVEGIGGVFFRARDPEALRRWYAERLGVEDGLDGAPVWSPGAGPTVFTPFPESTEKFATGKQWMLNFRVRDLDAMLAQLRAAGVAVEDELQHQQGVGRFAWLSDPEGNRIELWEPDRTTFANS